MYPKAYLDYLYHFHCDRDYFECHEVLEEYWKEKAVEEREIHWVGLIQIAVGLYHHRRSNFNGAKKMLLNARAITKKTTGKLEALGLDSCKLINLLDERIKAIQQMKPYTSMNLPISSSELQISCERLATNKNFVWGTKSNLADESLIHRHSLRDRTDVIHERQRQLALKKNRNVE
ncbi:hypothetical protein FIU87_12465 [Bacillus sp. THAF10]|uniref:DUF309 domain-containing protein n=1 Tax=Bacillus sp. THAF10 TaxID=2587848 RepID=UPI001269105E|nr:DUF309 domain-containing protein [Bacillus sp. THAF10]QFT89464.1 hypothetical protein FIU87_12465 [Bacillus sp. THAF10]